VVLGVIVPEAQMDIKNHSAKNFLNGAFPNPLGQGASRDVQLRRDLLGQDGVEVR
jgi:hypothetical protein